MIYHGNKRLRDKLKIGAILAAAYFAAGKISLLLPFAHTGSITVWPCAGIAFAACLIYGYEILPAVFVASFFVCRTASEPALVSLGIAVGNTLAAFVAAWLANRFAVGRDPFASARNVFRFALAGIGGGIVSAGFGVVLLAAAGRLYWAGAVPVAMMWWLGGVTGNLVVAPLILTLFAERHLRWTRAQFIEAAILFVSLSVTAIAVFNGVLTARGHYPFEYLCIPFLLWAAIRMGQREATAATLVLAGIALAATARGAGPFTFGSHNEAVMLAHAFIAISSLTTLVVATLFAETRRAKDQAQLLAVSDSMTGLGNYRCLLDTLQAEIRRSDRTGRSFVFLLMDLDGLKQVNDAYGHMAGSRALCRLAHVLRIHSRGIDTAARYGGDEFALIMPEAGAEVAAQVSERIVERLANDGEFPPVSVSIGHAVWPDDGRTAEALMEAADHVLYTVKAQRATQESPRPKRALAAGR